MKHCPHCHRSLIEIDHYGEMLVGCIDCNRWGHPGDVKLIMELKDSDLRIDVKSKVKLWDVDHSCSPRGIYPLCPMV